MSLSLESEKIYLNLEKIELKSNSFFSWFFKKSIYLKIFEFSREEIEKIINNEITEDITFEEELLNYNEIINNEIMIIEIPLKNKELNINIKLGEKEYFVLNFEKNFYFFKKEIKKYEKQLINKKWEGKIYFSIINNSYIPIIKSYIKLKRNIILKNNMNQLIKSVREDFGELIYEFEKKGIYYKIDDDLIFNPFYLENQELKIFNKFYSNNWGYSKLFGYKVYINKELEIIVTRIFDDLIFNKFKELISKLEGNYEHTILTFDRENIIFSGLTYFLSIKNNEYFSNISMKSKKIVHSLIRKRIFIKFKNETVQDEGTLLKNYIYETIESLKLNKRISWDGHFHKFIWSECCCITNSCSYCFREKLFDLNNKKVDDLNNKKVDDLFELNINEINSLNLIKRIKNINNEKINKKYKFKSINLKNLFFNFCYFLIKKSFKDFNEILKLFRLETQRKFLIFLFNILDESDFEKYFDLLRYLKIIEFAELIPSSLFFEFIANLFVLSIFKGFNIPLNLQYSFFCIILGLKCPSVSLQEKLKIEKINELIDLKTKYILNPEDLLNNSKYQNISWIYEYLNTDYKKILNKYLYSNGTNEFNKVLQKDILREFINYNISYLENIQIYNIFYNSFNYLLNFKMPKLTNIETSFNSFIDSSCEYLLDSTDYESNNFFIPFSYKRYGFDSIVDLTNNGNSFPLFFLHILNSQNLSWNQFLNLFTFDNKKDKNNIVIKKMFIILKKWFNEQPNIMLNIKIKKFFEFVIGMFPTSKDIIYIKVIDCPLNSVVFKSQNCFNILYVGNTNRLDLVESVFYESVFGSTKYTFA